MEYAHGLAREFGTKAVVALAGLKDSDTKDALIETAKFVGRRVV